MHFWHRPLLKNGTVHQFFYTGAPKFISTIDTPFLGDSGFLPSCSLGCWWVVNFVNKRWERAPRFPETCSSWNTEVVLHILKSYVYCMFGNSVIPTMECKVSQNGSSWISQNSAKKDSENTLCLFVCLFVSFFLSFFLCLIT